MSTKRVHIIAEAGTNHNGDINTAKKLVDLAKKAKADSVKFQIIYPEELYLPGQYEFGNYDIKEVIAMRKRFMLSEDEYFELYDYSSKNNIALTASIFDASGLDLLFKLNPKYIKIASTDLNNYQLLRLVAKKNIKIILSTGMSELSQIEKAVNELYKCGAADILLMHCVSAYPAKLENMNLGFIDTLKEVFNIPIGLSDHTQSSIAACVALGKGVSYIEKHFTIDSQEVGFDHKYAAEEGTFIQYIKDIRATELALRYSDVKLKDDELNVKKRARRSLYARRDINIGELIEEDDVLIVRPSGILEASDIDLIVGKRAVVSIKKYDSFTLDKIKN